MLVFGVVSGPVFDSCDFTNVIANVSMISSAIFALLLIVAFRLRFEQPFINSLLMLARIILIVFTVLSVAIGSFDILDTSANARFCFEQAGIPVALFGFAWFASIGLVIVDQFVKPEHDTIKRNIILLCLGILVMSVVALIIA